MKNLSSYIVLAMTIFATSGCSSHNDVISISEVHYYNEDFGLEQSYEADRQIEQELLAMNLPIEIDMPRNMNSGWTTELTKDPNAFYAHEYVQVPEIISYKYKFDKKFYDTAEWRKASF